MKTKTGTKSQVIVNIIIITVFVLGMLNTAQVNPVIASTMEDVTQQQESGPLEIAQGSSLHYSTGIEEELFFRLNVKVPAPGAAYAWKVLNPPAHGEVLVTGSGDSVEVNYIPASGYSGEDLFSVAVSDAGGNTDRIAVTVAIEAASILPDELDRIEADAALPFMAEELEPQRMREPDRILPREFEPECENQQKMDPMDVNPEDGYPLSRCGSMESGPLSDKWMVEKSRLIEQGMVAPQVSDPVVGVYLSSNEILSHNWDVGTSVTLTIDDPDYGDQDDYTASEVVDEDGWVYFTFSIFELEPGQIIEMTDGTYTVTYTVTNLAVTVYDEVAETLSGTADPGEVVIKATDGSDREEPTVIAGGDGHWTATFTEVDIKPGAYGRVYQYDDEGNFTIVYWYVPDPYIRAYPLGDYIYGYEWTANASIDLTIDDPAIPGGDYTDSLSANGEGSVYFYLNNFDLKPGQIIVMTDGTNTRTHTVKKVAVTTINQDTDKVKGTADPYSDLVTYACYRTCEKIYTTADSDGKWSATFTDVDIKPGTNGWVYQYDDEGNSTCLYWDIPNPYMNIDPQNNILHGYDWTPNTRVTLTIDGTNIASRKSNSNGSVYFDVDPFNVKSGQTVKMTDGVYSRTHVVRNIKVKEINQALDTVSGKASAGSAVEVFASERNGANRDYQVVTANSSGIWTADFHESVDIEPGSYGQVSQYDTKGNSTTISWDVPNPSFSVYPDQDIVSGWEWTPGATVTLTIGSDYTDDSTASEHGSVFFNLSSEYDILPGQTISMTDGVTSKDHLVRAIAVTELDEVVDDVKGTAAAGSEVQVVAFDDVSYGTGLNTTADSSGIWVADFSGYEDIKPGTWGFVKQEDDDGDYTCVDYELYKVPVIYTLGPSSAGVGSEPFTLNVNGENFVPVSKVRWNGEDRPTTFISHNQLSAEISADDLDLLGTADVQVFTPAPGGGISNTVSFEIFGAFPAFDEKLTYSKITFEWDEIPGATLYKIQLSTKADFSTLVFSAKTASLEYPYATALNFDTTYYWRIKAKIGGYWEPWSPYMRFESMDPLANPVLTYPGPGAEVDTATPTFTWDPVENGAQYMIQISKSKTFDTIILKPKVTDTEYTTITSLANGRYFWRVRAYDSSGVKGPWSEIRMFTVAVP